MSVRPSTPPGGAGGTVFKGDAGLGQLLADGVGLGEGADDLAPFDPQGFVDAIVGRA